MPPTPALTACRKLNLVWFFVGSSLLLFLLGAGITTNSFHELQEAHVFGNYDRKKGEVGWWNRALWDWKECCSPKNNEGFGLAKAFFGYSATSSFVQVLAYCAYVVLVCGALGARIVWDERLRTTASTTAAAAVVIDSVPASRRPSDLERGQAAAADAGASAEAPAAHHHGGNGENGAASGAWGKAAGSPAPTPLQHDSVVVELEMGSKQAPPGRGPADSSVNEEPHPSPAAAGPQKTAAAAGAASNKLSLAALAALAVAAIACAVVAGVSASGLPPLVPEIAGTNVTNTTAV